MPMVDYQKLVLRKICKYSWPANQIPHFLATLLDIAPYVSERSSILKTLCMTLKQHWLGFCDALLEKQAIELRLQAKIKCLLGL